MSKSKYLIFFTCIVFVFSCMKKSDFPLDPIFEDMKKNIPKNILEEFSGLPLDSAVINYKKYPEIFVDAATVAFQDSSQVILFENYCKVNGLSLNYEQDYYTIIAAFHKRLNTKGIDIKELRKEMIELSNMINEQQYNKPTYPTKIK